jgi:hypothetical protein
MDVSSTIRHMYTPHWDTRTPHTEIRIHHPRYTCTPHWLTCIHHTEIRVHHTEIRIHHTEIRIHRLRYVYTTWDTCTPPEIRIHHLRYVYTIWDTYTLNWDTRIPHTDIRTPHTEIRVHHTEIRINLIAIHVYTTWYTRVLHTDIHIYTTLRYMYTPHWYTCIHHTEIRIHYTEIRMHHTEIRIHRLGYTYTPPGIHVYPTLRYGYTAQSLVFNANCVTGWKTGLLFLDTDIFTLHSWHTGLNVSYVIYTGAALSSLKRARNEPYHSPPIAKVNNAWSFTSLSLYTFVIGCLFKRGHRLYLLCTCILFLSCGATAQIGPMPPPFGSF